MKNIKHFFVGRTLREELQAQYDETRRMLLEAESALESAYHTVEMLRAREQRLDERIQSERGF